MPTFPHVNPANHNLSLLLLQVEADFFNAFGDLFDEVCLSQHTAYVNVAQQAVPAHRCACALPSAASLHPADLLSLWMFTGRHEDATVTASIGG